MTDPMQLTGSDFLKWLQQHARDEGHTLRVREESAAKRGMQVTVENLAAADALAAIDEMIGEMLLIGATPVVMRIVKAGRAAVHTETVKREVAA